MRPWINQHKQALRLVLGRMRHRLLATLVMWCVMGVTVCLPAILFVIVDNLNRLTGNISTEPQISVFMKLDAEPASHERSNPGLDHGQSVQDGGFVEARIELQVGKTLFGKNSAIILVRRASGDWMRRTHGAVPLHVGFPGWRNRNG